MMQHDDERPRPQEEPGEAPETPPVEPKPAPVQDPPAEPVETPYVVRSRTPAVPASGHSRLKGRVTVMNDMKGRSNGERKERRGFASMTPEKQREIASKGGRAAHQKGTAHEEARSAGRKGGQISRGGRGRLQEDSMAESPLAEGAPAPDSASFDGQQ